MSTGRKVAYSAVGVLALLLVLLALVPLLFRGAIEERIKQAIAGNTEARVDWERVQLSLLRDFPNLTLRLSGLSVVGTDAFEHDTLLTTPRLAVALDLGSVARGVRGSGPVEVREVTLTRPAVQLIALEDGRANWQIMRASDEAPAASQRAFAVALRRVAIEDGRIAFQDRRADVLAVLTGLRHELSGDFSREQFTLRTHATVDTASVRFAGIPYLAGARLELSADVDADLGAKTFRLRENRLAVNALELQTEGQVALLERGVSLDLSFRAPGAEFGEILSLVPAVYAQDFAQLETAGRMAVAGQVRGVLGQHSFPAFALSATVEGGRFRYPDLPLAARDIELALSVDNPGGSADSTVLDVSRFHVVLGEDALDGSLAVRTPVSDPDVAFRVAGRLDLANLPRTIKLNGVEEIAGLVQADAGMRARLSDLEQQQYQRVSAVGRIEVRQLALRAAALRQPLALDEAVLRFTPQHVQLASLRGRAGASDVSMTGSLDNVLAFVLGRDELRGSARLASTRLDLNEWRSDDARKLIPVPGNIDFALTASADTVRFGTLALQAVSGGLRIADRRATLEDLRMRALGGALVVNGWYDTMDPAAPRFDIALGLEGVSVPAAFQEIRTVQAFAPVARYAEGQLDARIEMNGALGDDMLPIFERLSGLGSLVTHGLVLRAFPPFDRLADALQLPQLRNPGFQDVNSSFRIANGRLEVKPFQVRVDELALNVAGSNGIDQSIDYDLGLRLPRAALGEAAYRAVNSIAERGARAGIDLAAADSITLGVRLTGSITDPSIATSFRSATAGAVQTVTQALQDEAARRKQLAEERVDSAAAAARQRAEQQAAAVLAEAEQRAAELRAEAARLAEAARSEAHTRADSLEARATTAVARIAARAAADRVRKEADARADALIRAAEERAEAVLAEARQRADQLLAAPRPGG